MTGSQIADALDVSRNTVNKMMNAGFFKTIRALGDRPIYVVTRDEVEVVRKAQKPKT